ncbi:GNAT family N-acetyltransferase [Bacillus sp. FJAT-53060]|uniref:GNAT family N-acetyltransferase n=1 Tax=Bacillus sp. FJAT-53060 TaxID=3127666 RepID=UPI00301372A8
MSLLDTKEMIEDAAIVDIDPINHMASFRIALHGPEHFQKGYGTEAVRLVQAFAFDTLELLKKKETSTEKSLRRCFFISDSSSIVLPLRLPPPSK